MNWNNMCANCHYTRLRKKYDERTDSYRTTMAEMGVGCEACHGPMADHNAWQAKHPNQSGDPTVRKITRQEMFAACGQCHARRSELTGDFRPGENFFDHHQLTIPDETDLFYPDGQVRDEDYEYQGRPYKSLSAIARAITGTRWNGLLFFGLKNRRAPS